MPPYQLGSAHADTHLSRVAAPSLHPSSAVDRVFEELPLHLNLCARQRRKSFLCELTCLSKCGAVQALKARRCRPNPVGADSLATFRFFSSSTRTLVTCKYTFKRACTVARLFTCSTLLPLHHRRAVFASASDAWVAWNLIWDYRLSGDVVIDAHVNQHVQRLHAHVRSVADMNCLVLMADFPLASPLAQIRGPHRPPPSTKANVSSRGT